MEEKEISKILSKHLKKDGALQAFGEIISDIIHSDHKSQGRIIDEIIIFLEINNLYKKPETIIDKDQINLLDSIAEVEKEKLEKSDDYPFKQDKDIHKGSNDPSLDKIEEMDKPEINFNL